MKRLALLVAAFAALVALLFAMGGEGGWAGPSALSAGPDGLLAARSYLAARGTETILSDVPLGAIDLGEEAPGEGEVWVLSFPWPRPLEDAEDLALGHHLASGGSVVLAYSRFIEGSAERAVIEALGLGIVELRGPPPLLPWLWWRSERGEQELLPTGLWMREGVTGTRAPRLTVPRLTVPKARRAPAASGDAAVLYRSAEDTPLIFTFTHRGGRVVVLPGAVLANSGLPRSGHADLLESLRRELGGPWRFDEYHHGLVAPQYRPAATARFAWDLFSIHLALFYLLALVAVARRFGPAWREPRQAVGSAADFLRNVGSLHRRLGHHAAAARRLVEQRRQLMGTEIHLAQEAVPRDDAGLVGFARRLARPVPGERGASSAERGEP